MPSPLGLSHPLWIEDPEFNLEYHLRRVACPAPGDQKALCEFMSSVYAYQLDRSRPLWISWIVEGLAGDKVALVTLIHHAYVDGVGASYAMQQFFSAAPGAVPAEAAHPWQPEKYPSWFKRLRWGIRDLPGTIATYLPRAIEGFRKKRMVNEVYRQAGKPPPPSASVMPLTPINKALSHGRTFVCDTISLDTVKQVRTAYGVTINDVFLSCCAAAIRRLLLDKGYDPAQGPLVAGIPISGSRPDTMHGIGNFATVDFTWLHTDIEDPLERLQASCKSAAEMKEHIEAARGADINTLVQLAPPWLAKLISWGIRGQQGKFGIFGNVVLSNVPGPQNPLYFEHCKVENWFSTGQVFDGTALNMTLWSYAGLANLCILADREILPDGWILFDYFRDDLNRLLELTETKTGTETASVEEAEH